jgi:hypothetical protein
VGGALGQAVDEEIQEQFEPLVGVVVGEMGGDGDEVRELTGGERCEVPGHGVG